MCTTVKRPEIKFERKQYFSKSSFGSVDRRLGSTTANRVAVSLFMAAVVQLAQHCRPQNGDNNNQANCTGIEQQQQLQHNAE